MPRLVEVLMDAEKRSSSMVEEAKKRAEEIIEEAKKEAERIIEEARRAQVEINHPTSSDINFIVEEAKKEAERIRKALDARIKDLLGLIVREVIFGE
ncbi:MAG: hypothetical protein ACP5KE_06235 [Candidatus Methanodesulfokora sp.]|nr:MAG: hypothetical protein C0200_02940 [Candidatus Korarchaeota archaeon]